MLTISQIDPHFTECLDSVGFSRLTKYPVVRLWRQMNSRLGLLTRIEYSMHSYMSKLFTSDITSPDDDSSLRFFSYMHSLTRMKTYVELCIAQLDINNTIDKAPVGDLSFTWTTDDDDAIFHHDVPVFTPLIAHWNDYWVKFPVALIKEYFSDYCEFPSGQWDDAAKILVKSTYASRRSVVMSRLLAALRTAHNDGWYMVFDTITLAPDRVKAFYETPNALRDYFRSIGKSVAVAGGLPASKSTKDVYQYFCCPEYGSERGRLHFHCIHLCKHLPLGSVDPNLNARVRSRRQIDSFRGFWSYGNTLLILMLASVLVAR
nr:DNA replication stages II and III protein [Pectobacterium phage Mimer]